MNINSVFPQTKSKPQWPVFLWICVFIPLGTFYSFRKYFLLRENDVINSNGMDMKIYVTKH